MGPLGDMKPWNTKGIEGVYRFLKRAYNEFIGEDGHIAPKVISVPEKNEQTEKLLHATIKKVTQDIEALRFNTAISQMMIFLNHVQTVPEVSINTVKAFIQLLAPFAPHMAEEIWERLGGQGYVCIAPWPSYDEKKLISEFATIAVQINGKFRAELELPVNADEVAAMAAAKANERVKAQLADKAIHKVIFVKGRLLNIVTI